ncbi:RHS repeat-associated core domain-containing protein [Enterococcus casseliflavus]|uniref:RHS repeat-associated core domain-containing protein n=1 Tax=Enterococcus casseliflavus TaxID=37734 RepID=A0AAW8UTC4_ENTCA|nr:RHS repeat-associated core domain-containing protein [Enterococcus casseliflavus]MDT2966115.1 RHS repeat-associated core domain-containing protein [Enterococcus casseliflavus]
MSKKINGQITNYHYDGDSNDVLYETDTNGQVLRHYIYSDDNIRLAMKSGKNKVYYHYNGHGDVVALTDESGQQVASYTYDAWGNVLTSEAKTELAKSNPYGYAGYTYDAEIQQYYLMARYYHPAHGVFTSLDPDPGDEDDPLTMNGYTYADNNPVMYVDPNGHFTIVAGLGIYISAKVIFTGVTMLAGAGIGYYLAKKRPYTKIKNLHQIFLIKALRDIEGKLK